MTVQTRTCGVWDRAEYIAAHADGPCGEPSHKCGCLPAQLKTTTGWVWHRHRTSCFRQVTPASSAPGAGVVLDALRAVAGQAGQVPVTLEVAGRVAVELRRAGVLP